MANRIFVLGLTFQQFGSQQPQAILNISRPLMSVDNEKYKRRVIGESGEVNLKYDQPLQINYQYALELERTGALVPRREYDCDLEFNPSNVLGGSMVAKLIPVDAEIKKHFAESLKLPQ